MPRTSFFALAGGLNGCYMPDSEFGHFAIKTRRDLMQAVRDALAFYELPKSALHEVKWRRVWAHAQRNGLSSLSFSVGDRNGFGLQFMGLTEAEYAEREAREDW